jgi:hypothetical protein
MNESEAGSYATYHEENGRLILTNPLLAIAFSEADGTIVSFVQRETGTDVVEPEDAATDGYLWRLRLAADGAGEFEVTNRDCAEFTHDLGRHRHRGALRLWLQWRGFRTGGKFLDATLTAQVTLPESTASALFEEEIELPAGYTARSLALPCLTAVSYPDPMIDDGLFLPLSGGVLLPNPRSLSPAGQPRTWGVGYPGPGSLQLLGYARGERTTVWLAAQDQSGARKMLAAAGMPSTGRLALWITHYPTVRADGHWSTGYPSAVGVVNGGWFEAAREYRGWAAEQPWAARGRGGERILPPLTTAYGLWASYWGGARRCVSAIRELQRIVNVPIKLDWRCWHSCARDGAYPDYLPPRDGEAAWSAAEQQLGEAGVLDQVSINALLASEESAAWREHDLAPHAIQLDGEPAPLGRPLRPPLSTMCPGTEHWRNALATVAREIAGRGADGIVLEDLGSAGATTCHALNHEHRPANPAGWAISVRALLSEVRAAVGESRQIATDEMSEPYIADVDAFLSSHAAAERQMTLPEQFGHRWIPIPLFASVYHDYTTLVGPAASLLNQRPHDPAWPASTISELREPTHVMQRDYQTQFCLEVARALIWGYQPLLESFHPDQARDDANRRKLAFLAAALRAQAWGIGALLPQSQFMGPIAVECPTIEADMLVNPPYSGAADRRSVRRSLPSVQGSAWRVPGGGLALVLVNIHNQAVDFTARLRSSRLNLHLPLRLMGRTFSEDGDVPGASLGTSGSDISGRLPGRAIVLISLR